MSHILKVWALIADLPSHTFEHHLRLTRMPPSLQYKSHTLQLVELKWAWFADLRMHSSSFNVNEFVVAIYNTEATFGAILLLPCLSPHPLWLISLLSVIWPWQFCYWFMRSNPRFHAWQDSSLADKGHWIRRAHHSSQVHHFSGWWPGAVLPHKNIYSKYLHWWWWSGFESIRVVDRTVCREGMCDAHVDAISCLQCPVTITW